MPLRGFIRLAWGDVPTVVTRARWPGARRRSRRAARSVWLRATRTCSSELSALPMVELRRPREWEQAADAADRLLDALAG